jgi:hypothetical protein
MFERLMYNRLITFIERNNVLYSSQYGFRNNHSTEHALLNIVKNLKSLETIVNKELIKLNDWLISNKLSLNIKKSNLVIFHTYQKTLNYIPNLKISDHNSQQYIALEHKKYIKYLGILIDSHLTSLE